MDLLILGILKYDLLVGGPPGHILTLQDVTEKMSKKLPVLFF